MQHFEVKLFAAGPVDLAPAIPVFHRWIRESVLPELLIDVADYRHVPAGPGVLLVGYESHYGLDLRSNRLGLLYSRRTAGESAPAELLEDALRRLHKAAAMLESEPEFAGKLRFEKGNLEIRVNDRALAPNTPETVAALQPAVTAALDNVLGSGSYRAASTGSPRELVTFQVQPS